MSGMRYTVWKTCACACELVSFGSVGGRERVVGGKAVMLMREGVEEAEVMVLEAAEEEGIDEDEVEDEVVDTVAPHGG